MKPLFYILAFVASSAIHAVANEWKSDYPLIAGHYEVIGQKCETRVLFAGTIIIDETGPNLFVVTRIIEGNKIIGSGKVEFATADKIPVFRIRFVENGAEFEGTFLWRGDLDNYGRISGHVYTKGYEGDRPGLEALFAKRESE